MLIVSHDRYFLDRLVDHVFAFEGNGVVKDFPGNYTEYRQWKDDMQVLEEAKAKGQFPNDEAPEESNDNKIEIEKPGVTEKKKLSFKEQKELETIEKDLEMLEKRKTEIESLLAGGTTNVAEIQKLSDEFNTVNLCIDEKTMRWLELHG